MRSRSLLSHAVRLGALIFLTTGCVDGTQSSRPSAAAPVTPAIPPQLTPPPAFPPLSRSGTIYRAPDSLYDLFANYHQSQLASRYVLYDGGTFGLQFVSARFSFFEYAGHYSSMDSVLTFTFDGDSRWQATATMRGDSLVVTYNLMASLSDFLDGVYVRSPAQ